jgi:F-type H+-transporting ATPase subunit delta
MQEKVQVLESVLKKEPVDPAFDRFLRVLIMMGHIELLVEISDAYTVALREQRNEVQAKLRSAFPLEEKDQARIAKALSKATGKNVQIDVAIDPALIGGVVAEVGGVVYDASIQGYLNRLQEEFAV